MRFKKGWLLILTFVTWGTRQGFADASNQNVPFEIRDGYRIVVTGSIRGMDNFRMMIDTGADCSVVDRDVVKRLDLRILSESVQFNAFGRIKAAQRVILPVLRIGPILTTLPSLVADIPYRNVDAIIGLDLLRRYRFLIDYEQKQLVFGSSDPLGETVPFDAASSLVVIPLCLGDDTLQVMIDTGADCLYLFKQKLPRGLLMNSVRSGFISTNLAGRSEMRETCLREAQIGRAIWQNVQAFIVDAAQAPECDGALGITALKLRKIYFDFKNGSLSFIR